jgi:glycosyltransferase involved in cell wall biosynthesis
MLKLIDLNYYMHADILDPEEVLKLHAASTGFVKFIHRELDIQFVKHMDYEGEKIIEGIRYNFFKSRNNFWYIPFKANRFVQLQRPDIVIIQGLIFPLQLLALRLMLKKKTKIIVQHHGEKPFTGIKKAFQQIAKYFIDGYIFTSTKNSEEWIKSKIIAGKEKCYEVLEASTYFERRNKNICKSALSINGNLNFLWVGRLILGKDPITVLKAFEKYIVNHHAKLFMIYQTDELLPEINLLLSENGCLKNSVILKGGVLHHELETWYNAADFYITGSHKESTGYALLEAIACGCIPVVTDIPSFRKITNGGDYGFLFEPGNEQNLLDILLQLEKADRKKLSSSVVEHFNNSLSFKSIADSLYDVCKNLISE